MSGRFSAALKAKLAERGMKQAELARRIGVRSKTVNNYVGGSREPDFATVERIADALRCEVSELVDPPVPPALAPVAGRVSCSIKTNERLQLVSMAPQPVPPGLAVIDAFWVIAAGLSMYPEGVDHGDWVLVSRSRTPAPGDRVWLLDAAGMATLKRLTGRTGEAMALCGWGPPESGRQSEFAETRPLSMIAEAWPVVAVLDGRPSSDPPPKSRPDPRAAEFAEIRLAARVAAAIGLDPGAQESDIFDRIEALRASQAGTELDALARAARDLADRIARFSDRLGGEG